MTCREFKHGATSLTLWELSQARDQKILGHAGECQKCAAWLQQQSALTGAMRTLQAQTAGSEAGLHVEQALLLAFRQGSSLMKAQEMEYRPTAMAIRLSRFFEVGAYVAVAAAILVGVFLGVQLLKERSASLPVQSQAAPSSVGSQKVVADSRSQQVQVVAPQGSTHSLRTRHVQTASQPNHDAAEPAQTSTDAGYVALMLCDPLSCSGDAQVVRMELPNPTASSSGEQDAQMRIADVVVGYDGVVRAVRIVN